MTYKTISEMLTHYKSLVEGKYKINQKEFEKFSHIANMCGVMLGWIEEIWVDGGLKAVRIHNYGKFNRWLGYIQGILYMHDLIDVAEERNLTRPILTWVDCPSNRMDTYRLEIPNE